MLSKVAVAGKRTSCALSVSLKPMVQSTFRRARSVEHKRQRAGALVEAARSPCRVADVSRNLSDCP
jgi:hypothetical protein